MERSEPSKESAILLQLFVAVVMPCIQLKILSKRLNEMQEDNVQIDKTDKIED